MDHSRLHTRLSKHDAVGKRTAAGGLRLFRSRPSSRPNLQIKTRDLQFEAENDSNELDLIELYGLDSDRESVDISTNSTLPRHLQCSSRASSSSDRSSIATAVVSPLNSGLGTATNSSRSSTIPTPVSTVPPTPASTVPPSEYVSQSPVLPREYTDAWLESQLAKAEQSLCGLRTELIFYYQRKIMKENIVQSMKEAYEDRREGHTRAIAEYMTTGIVAPRGVQDTTTTLQSGPQGVGVEMEGGGKGIGCSEVGEAEQVKQIEEVELVGKDETDKVVKQTDKTLHMEQKDKASEQTDKTLHVEQTGKPTEQTGKSAEQTDKAVEHAENSRVGGINRQMAPYVPSLPTISIIEATPPLIRAPWPLSGLLSHPYIRCRKSPPPPPPIDENEAPPVPLKSVLRQLSVPVVPLRAANYGRSFTPPALVGLRLDTETSTVPSSPSLDLLSEIEFPLVPPIQFEQEQLRRPDTETIILGPSPTLNQLPEIESPPMPPVQSVQLPIVPPRPAFIRGKNRNFTSPAILQLPPGQAVDTETIAVGPPAPPIPAAGLPPTPLVQTVRQQLPLVPPRPAFIRGNMRNITTPGSAMEASTVSPPLTPLSEPLPVPPLNDSLVLVQQQHPTAVPLIARPATRVDKRSFTAPALLATGPDTVMATLASRPATTQRRPFLLPSVASSRVGTPAPAVPMTADESRRKVPTRLNNFSALLETFNQRPAQQPNAKL